MAVGTQSNSDSFVSAGTLTARAIPFPFAQASDVVVTRVNANGSETVLTAGSDFTITGDGRTGAGLFTPLIVVTSGLTVRLQRTTALLQPYAPSRVQALDAPAIERQLDDQVMTIIDTRAVGNSLAARALRVPIGETIAPLPSIAGRASRFLFFSALGAIAALTATDVAAMIGPLLPPYIRGDKGDPGSSALAVGRFTDLAALNIPLGTDMIRTSGHAVVGSGSALYVTDAAVNDAYVAANPYSAVKTANGRFFRLDVSSGVWVEAFGADMTGATVTAQARATAWLNIAALVGQPARMGAGLLMLDDTPGANVTIGVGDVVKAIDCTNKRLLIVGAGIGISTIQRAAGSVTANAQCLLRFAGNSGAYIGIRDLTLDMDSEVGNVTPGGSLASNFTWQHCGCAEFRGATNADYGIETIDCSNIEISRPIADGISIRGGNSGTGATVRNAFLSGIRNTKWDASTDRPRVRGDITVTAIIDNLTIVDPVMPRLHMERDAGLLATTVQTSRILIINPQVGELLGHNPGNYSSGVAGYEGFPERIRIAITGGQIRNGGQIGCGIITIEDTQITLRKTSGVRLTEGDLILRNCSLRVAASYVNGQGTSGAFFTSSNPYCRNISLEGGTLDVDAGATPPPWALFVGDNGGGATGTVRMGGGFYSRATAMQLLFARQGNVEIDGAISDYAGGGVLSGAAVQIGPSATGGAKIIGVRNVRLTNPAAVLFSPPSSAPSGSGGIMNIAFGNNSCGVGKAFDFSVAGYGAAARTLYSSAWTLTSFSHVSRVAAKPTTGDFMDGEVLYLTTAAPSSDYGLFVTTRGPAPATAVFSKLPALGVAA